MDPRPKAPHHSRQNSTAATPAPNAEFKSPQKPHLDAVPPVPESNTHYTLFIRLPFARNGFQDPPPVEWNAAKDEDLWKIISGSSGKQLNWETICGQFRVSLPFLLQQAAWLYERRLESMRAQMKRLGTNAASGSASPSPSLPQGGGIVVGGESMVRTGSRDSQKPSAINTQKINPPPPGDGVNSPGTPRTNRPMYSRTPSTVTVTESKVLRSSPRPLSQVLHRGSDGTIRKRTQTFEPLQDEDDDVGLSHDGTSESESEDEPAATSRSQAFRRSHVNKKPVAASLSSDGDIDDDDDDDDSGGFLPFAAASKSTKPDPAATLRNSPAKPTISPQQPSTGKGKSKEIPPESSASSASSAQQPPSSNNDTRPVLSPRHRAELQKLSPRYKKSGSEGSPSMGSSFSDLDDASVTQSALDDAILSTMQHQSMGMTLGAGMGSRISGLRDALARR